MNRQRPILFSAPMVRALLSDRKTQTRRPLKLAAGHDWYPDLGGQEAGYICDPEGPGWWHVDEMACPYGAPGDVLWVRESVYIAPPNFGDVDLCNVVDNEKRQRLVGYAASMDADAKRCANDFGIKLSPGIHMPRWASRLSLKILEVRAEKLQDISEEDALAEGTGEPSLVQLIGGADVSERNGFARLWEKIHGKGSWTANPWVWVITFERVRPS